MQTIEQQKPSQSSPQSSLWVPGGYCHPHRPWLCHQHWGSPARETPHHHRRCNLLPDAMASMTAEREGISSQGKQIKQKDLFLWSFGSMLCMWGKNVINPYNTSCTACTAGRNGNQSLEVVSSLDLVLFQPYPTDSIIYPHLPMEIMPNESNHPPEPSPKPNKDAFPSPWPSAQIFHNSRFPSPTNVLINYLP